jgi:hypothetical protein
VERVAFVPSLKSSACDSNWTSLLRATACLVLMALGPTQAAAGTVSIMGTNALGAAVVKVSGPIRKGDGTRFLAATARFREAIVVLEGPGGSVDEGLRIAELIRARSFSTAVLSGASCASMCAVVWLTGSKRLMANGARIGFHAVADVANRKVSSAGNAIAGAYLAGLGFGVEAIAFMTSAPPSSIAWLTRDRAVDLKIEVLEADPVLTAATRPATEVPLGHLDLWASTLTATFACERGTMESLLKNAQKGAAERKRFIASNDELISSTCQHVREKTEVVIREISAAHPIACVEIAPERDCQWAPLFALRTDPHKTPWPAMKSLPERSDAEVCRAALEPSGRGWNVNFWSAVQEADRRGLSLEACTALKARSPGQPGPTSTHTPILGPPGQAKTFRGERQLSAGEAEACKNAVTESGWVIGPASDALRERGISFERCRLAVLLPAAMDAARAAEPVVAEPGQRDETSLCLFALTTGGDGWDTNSWSYVEEAGRRGLGLDSCRAVLTCNSKAVSERSRQVLPLACERDLENATVGIVCGAALSRDRRSWSEDPVFGFAVAEAKRRGLSKEYCTLSVEAAR